MMLRHHPRSDLIDTLWNVKVMSIRDNLVGFLDLIDTLWNVKVEAL